MEPSERSRLVGFGGLAELRELATVTFVGKHTLLGTLPDLGESSSGGSLRIGMQAGPWLIESELGRGGMGVVYAVHHAQIGKRAALRPAAGLLRGRARRD